MASVRENVYQQGQLVKIRAVFVDPATTTSLLAVAPLGVTAITVRSVELGATIQPGSIVALGSGRTLEVVTVSTVDVATGRVAIAAPVTFRHEVNESFALLVEAGMPTYKIKPPHGAVQTPTPTKLGTGQWVASTVGELPGTYYWRAEIPNVAPYEGAFRVAASAF